VVLVGGVLLIAILLLAFTAGVILAQTPAPANPLNNFGWGRGPGMMGSRGMGFGPGANITGTIPYGYGRGMMGGRGMGFGPGANTTEAVPYGRGMMGGWYGRGNGPMRWQQNLTSTTGLTNTCPCGLGGQMGRGMMGYWGNNTGQPITADEAKQAAEQYLAAYNDPNLVIDELMTFSQNFYVQVKEKDSDLKALELLVDPYNGFVHPEPGPNMMWNTKYGHMAQWSQPTTEMTVTPAQAQEYAQSFLDTNLPGVTVDEEVEIFPGYYTLHTLKDGQIQGMLSVNGYTGQVWYHHWHGDFLEMTEVQ
jgi:hypothetical protein